VRKAQASQLVPTALKDGFTAQRATASTTVRGVEVRPHDQGRTNACGTSSLAAVFEFWGKPVPRERIDSEIRRMNMFTAPDALVDYATRNGMRASLKSGASTEDVAKMIDQGTPVITLMEPFFDVDPSDLGLHYVTVSGYTRGADGEIESFRIADSATNSVYEVSAEEFERAWSNLRLKGVATGFDRVMLTVVPEGNRQITGTDGVTRRASEIQLPGSTPDDYLESMPIRALAQGSANVVNGLARGEWSSVLAGRTQLVGGLIGAAISKFPVPGAKWFGGAVATAAFYLGEAVKDVSSAVTRLARGAVDAVGGFFKKLFG